MEKINVDKKQERSSGLVKEIISLMKKNPGENVFKIGNLSINGIYPLPRDLFKENEKIEVALETLQENQILRFKKESIASTYTKQNNLNFYGEITTTNITFFIIDVQKSVVELEKYLHSIKNLHKSRVPIETIHVMGNDKTEDGRLTIIINNDYLDESVRPKSKGMYWGKLLEVAEEGGTTASNPKKITDYFNTNKNCMIYKSNKYTLTIILGYADGKIFPKIKIEKISSKKFSQSRNNQLKKT